MARRALAEDRVRRSGCADERSRANTDGFLPRLGHVLLPDPKASGDLVGNRPEEGAVGAQVLHDALTDRASGFGGGTDRLELRELHEEVVIEVEGAAGVLAGTGGAEHQVDIHVVIAPLVGDPKIRVGFDWEADHDNGRFSNQNTQRTRTESCKSTVRYNPMFQHYTTSTIKKQEIPLRAFGLFSGVKCKEEAKRATVLYLLLLHLCTGASDEELAELLALPTGRPASVRPENRPNKNET